jgi:hypothetical protein
MTKLILTAALAAFLVTPLAMTAHAGSSDPAPSGSSSNRAAACNSITDPVKKAQCLKSSSGQMQQHGSGSSGSSSSGGSR